jgi:hypothetical protein
MDCDGIGDLTAYWLTDHGAFYDVVPPADLHNIK